MSKKLKLIVLDSEEEEMETKVSTTSSSSSSSSSSSNSSSSNSRSSGSKTSAKFEQTLDKRKSSDVTKEEEDDEDCQVIGSIQKPKRKCEYVAVEENLAYETAIDNVKTLDDLTPEQIEYMVLRDVNYFLDIFSGACEHSWRHREYKKFSKRIGNMLYENSALNSYTYDQYMGAVKALQYVFCKNHHRYDEYIVKVLLPEALIKICMRIFQCSKDAAEEFLAKSNMNKPNAYPRGSAIYSPAATKNTTKTKQSATLVLTP